MATRRAQHHLQQQLQPRHRHRLLLQLCSYLCDVAACYNWLQAFSRLASPSLAVPRVVLHSLTVAPRAAALDHRRVAMAAAAAACYY